VTYDLSQLPILVTRQECARLLGLADGRRLNACWKPVACTYIHGKPAPLFELPTDSIYAARCVNSPNRPNPITENAADGSDNQ
jgi:hypothetical protein